MQGSSLLDRKEASAWDTAAQTVIYMHRQWSSVWFVHSLERTKQWDSQKAATERARISLLPFLPQVPTSLPIKTNLWTLPGIKKDDLLKLLIYTHELKSSSEKLFHKFWMNLRSGKILEKHDILLLPALKRFNSAIKILVSNVTNQQVIAQRKEIFYF